MAAPTGWGITRYATSVTLRPFFGKKTDPVVTLGNGGHKADGR